MEQDEQVGVLYKGHIMGRALEETTHGTGVVDLDENLVLPGGGYWDLLDLSLELLGKLRIPNRGGADIQPR